MSGKVAHTQQMLGSGTHFLSAACLPADVQASVLYYLNELVVGLKLCDSYKLSASNAGEMFLLLLSWKG